MDLGFPSRTFPRASQFLHRLVIFKHVHPGVITFPGEFEESGKLYKEAQALAHAAGDGEAVEEFQEGLKELANRRDWQTKSKTEELVLKA
ncbi:tetratricopeptide repeat protein 19, mitochondrial-like [Xyrauchen texanus]|uniref:tetratricopeptide repeat protein 19, mitochondrial-like n=1 Tax=Xyrauchen texanus TaxID=154827 RepID=UPI002241C11D|nr:tetratricopeptide repeat protein 19, mitochondrial-like [Xyrauchen texanus]